MTSVRTESDQQQWDDYVVAHSGHPMQLWGWGQVKAAHNWQVQRVYVEDAKDIIAGAQLLIRRLPRPFKSLVYIPRGPVVADQRREEVLQTLADYVKQTLGAVALSVEPDVETMAIPKGWVRAKNTILIPDTLILDLEKSEADLLADMAKKTRQYIRKSTKDIVDIHQVEDKEELGLCLEIYKDTAKRAGFPLHADQYYYDVFSELGEHSPVFVAYSEGKPVAFLWLAISAAVSFELYGGMSEEGQRLRANYALKWHAITQTRKWGIKRYDMNGLLGDGVSTFKQGFASHANKLVGTIDKPLSPLYGLWTHGLPAAKKTLRKLKSLRK